MVIISGSTPQASNCRSADPTTCHDNPHPAVPIPPRDFPEGIISNLPFIPPVAARDVVLPLCNTWCLSTGMYDGALSHSGVDGDHGKCMTRCAMNNDATPQQVAAWGLPSLAGPPGPASIAEGVRLSMSM